MTDRKRFSLLDAVVMLLAVGIGAVLLLPALQQMRERSRRQLCVSNLAALGKAMHSYHDRHKMFPPGIVSDLQYVAAENAGRSDFSSASGFTLLLPHLDEAVTYDLYNRDRGCATAANATAVSRRLRLLNCPSNQASTGVAHSDYYGGQVGTTDYALNLGGVGIMTPESPYSLCTCNFCISLWRAGSSQSTIYFRPSAGLLNVNSNWSDRHVKDGCATTLMIGEAVSGLPVADPKLLTFREDSPVRDRVHSAWSQGYISSAGRGGHGSVFAATCNECGFNIRYQLLLNRVLPLNEFGTTQSRSTNLQRSISKVNYPAASLTFDCGHIPTEYPFDESQVRGFQSLHPGGANFLMADGQVRWISEKIDPRIYVGLSTINGRERIDDKAF